MQEGKIRFFAPVINSPDIRDAFQFFRGEKFPPDPEEKRETKAAS
jgi:hypothetical protein